MDRDTRDGLKIGLLLGTLVAVGLLALLAGCAPAPHPVVVPPPPPAPSCSLTVHVFAGDPAADVKVPGARVQVADQVAETDAAGNATLGPFGVGSYIATATADGYVEGRVDGIPLCAQTSVDVSLTRAAPARPPVRLGQVQVRGRRLTYPDGASFPWRGVTGFLVPEAVAHGRDADARAYLRWARDAGFDVVRVLVMLPGGWDGEYALTPGEGLAVLPRVFALADEEDVYLHVTVLANTATLPASADLGRYVEQAGQLCAATTACALVELANEPWHPTQRGDVHDPATLARWAARVPRGLPVALGAAADDESVEMAGGTVVTAHLDRGRDTWNMARRVRELENVSATTGKPVVSGEPIGFAEMADPGRRLADPSVAFAFGVLGRIFTVPTNLHLADGLLADVPGPVQQKCAAAFIEGATLIPAGVALTFANATWTGSPVTSARFVETYGREGVVRAYSGLSGARGWTVLLGLTGDPGLVWGGGWAPTGIVAERPGIRVLSIERR